MADELRTGERIAATAETLGRSFATELGRVLRDADRALRPILRAALDGSRGAQATAARGVALRRQLRHALTSAGYETLVEASTTAAVARMADAVLASRLTSRAAGLMRPDPTRLQALAQIGRENLLGVADELAGALWRSLTQWLWTVRDTDAILADLADVFEDEVANLQTLFDTQVSMFGRQVEAMATATMPADQPYLFVGPVDALTREWCLDHAGKVYTRDVIEAMDNGQLPNPFITGGGYSCRHSFIAVESPELRALTNTGEVAQEFRLDVARAKEMREQRRRRRRAA